MPEETHTKKERTCQTIRDATYNLIIEQGYSVTLMRHAEYLGGILSI